MLNIRTRECGGRPCRFFALHWTHQPSVVLTIVRISEGEDFFIALQNILHAAHFENLKYRTHDVVPSNPLFDGGANSSSIDRIGFPLISLMIFWTIRKTSHRSPPIEQTVKIRFYDHIKNK